MEDKISIIVPVYNVEKYLNRCVDSILNQTYRNLEIILVDDGSPDNCGAVCDAYAGLDPRIRVIHKPNGGLSDARNAGLDVATGEYVGFIDSDDFIHPSQIQDDAAIRGQGIAGQVDAAHKGRHGDSVLIGNHQYQPDLFPFFRQDNKGRFVVDRRWI